MSENDKEEWHTEYFMQMIKEMSPLPNPNAFYMPAYAMRKKMSFERRQELTKNAKIAREAFNKPIVK